MNRTCNCYLGDEEKIFRMLSHKKTNPNFPKCAYNSICQHVCLVYQVKCRECEYVYIRSIQQTLKDRMNGHFQDIRKLIIKGDSSNSFAVHFRMHVRKDWNNDFRPLFLRQKMNFYIKWLGNLIACNKSFGRYNCKLCMQERLELIWGLEKMKKTNKNSNRNRNGKPHPNEQPHRLLCILQAPNKIPQLRGVSNWQHWWATIM